MRGRVGEKVNAFIRSPFKGEILLKQRVIYTAPLTVVPHGAVIEVYRHLPSLGK